ncbi:endonuclease/exonuclease/phosphatase family protein [Egicoccus sp. AB-alg6-2]|uniref:endonuclease/exonuclease/phosphatase family protein n=1 Tax=Egicoccus sp. AB-alg6-2 TaxID=3242692 RepID=UPI00359CDD64
MGVPTLVERAQPLRLLRAAAVTLVALLLLATGGVAEAAGGGKGQARADAAAAARGGPPVTVMTRNLYLGSELGPIFAAADQQQLIGAASQVWANVLASDFPARARVLAEEVARERPLLIGLQEVSRFTAQGAGGSITVDFLDILLDALAARGLSYAPVSVAPAFEGTLPAMDPTLGFVNATLLDRDVILARTDVPPAQLRILDEASGVFDAALTLPLPGAGPDAALRIDRGWQYVDVGVRNREFRFVNSHFEAFDPGEVVRVAQARELLAGALDTDLPVILVGDFNSDANAGGRAYGVLTGVGGFVDVWSALRPGEPGLTCCHPADLRGEEPLRSRIDLILVRDGIRPRNVEVIGVDPALRTPSGLWPSDHAGVVATVMITAR